MFKLAILNLALVFVFIHTVDSLKPNNIDSSAANSNSQICGRRSVQVDKCLPKLVVYGDRSFEPPRTDQQLDQHCRLLDDNVKCVSSFSRECLPAFARNIYSVVTRRMKTQFAKRCKTADGRKDFLNMMHCADAKHMEKSHKCMDSFIASLEKIGNGNQERKVELTCCTMQVFQQCIFTASKQMDCPQRVVSAEKAIEYVRSLINSMGGDVMEFMCGKYDKVSTCVASYPDMMAQFRSISERIQNGTMKPQSSSPFKPMLNLFTSGQDE